MKIKRIEHVGVVVRDLEAISDKKINSARLRIPPLEGARRGLPWRAPRHRRHVSNNLSPP